MWLYGLKNDLCKTYSTTTSSTSSLEKISTMDVEMKNYNDNPTTTTPRISAKRIMIPNTEHSKNMNQDAMVKSKHADDKFSIHKNNIAMMEHTKGNSISKPT